MHPDPVVDHWRGCTQPRKPYTRYITSRRKACPPRPPALQPASLKRKPLGTVQPRLRQSLKPAMPRGDQVSFLASVSAAAGLAHLLWKFLCSDPGPYSYAARNQSGDARCDWSNMPLLRGHRRVCVGGRRAFDRNCLEQRNTEGRRLLCTTNARMAEADRPG